MIQPISGHDEEENYKGFLGNIFYETPNKVCNRLHFQNLSQLQETKEDLTFHADISRKNIKPCL